MLSKTFFLLLLFPALLQGFTLDVDGSKKSLKPPGLSANSLLGWSMAHYNEDIILGAPLESGTGIIWHQIWQVLNLFAITRCSCSVLKHKWHRSAELFQGTYMIDFQSGSLKSKEFRNEPPAQVEAGMGAQYRPQTQPFSCAATESTILPSPQEICTWGGATPSTSTTCRVPSLISNIYPHFHHMNQLSIVMESMG